MIRKLIRKLRESIEERKVKKFISVMISKFTDEDWNRVTAGVILDLYLAGESHYKAFNGFIDAHYIPEEFAKVFNQRYTLTYPEVIMMQTRLTDDQRKLLRTCKTRKIKSKLVSILETIDEYEHTNNFSDYSNSIVFDDLSD